MTTIIFPPTYFAVGLNHLFSMINFAYATPATYLQNRSSYLEFRLIKLRLFYLISYLTVLSTANGSNFLLFTSIVSSLVTISFKYQITYRITESTMF